MHKRRASVFSIVALLSLGLTASAAMSQTKPNTTGTPKKSPTVAARTVPPIKCTDPDSMVACKSFKQLVDARDKDLLYSLTGDKDSRERHYAYVCLRPKDDAFSVVEFDEPLPEEYRPYSPPDAAKNPVFALQEQLAFPYWKGKPVLPLSRAQQKWYEDHDDFSVYAVRQIYVDSWQSGILTNYVHDIGRWRRFLPTEDSRSNEHATFTSAHQWLADFNEANANQLASADDQEKPRISVGDTSISVQYSFKNKNDEYTDYTLTIQRSTGRFTESFVAPGLDPFDNAGSCMSFKQ